MNTHSRYLGQKLFFKHIAVPTPAIDMEGVLNDYIANSPAESADRITIADIIRRAGGLTSPRDFVFANLLSVTCFPEGFNPQGHVEVWRCPSFTVFPEGFNPKGNVHIRRCSSFTVFPEGFNPQGEVTVCDCPSFTVFPEGFNPQGNVNVWICPSFMGFSEGFNPQGHVEVSDCLSFTGFLEGFNPQGNVTINDCPSFTRIPDSFFRMPRSARVDLRNTGLTASGVHTINERQNTHGYNGPRFDLSIRDHYQSDVAISAADLGRLLQGFGYRPENSALIRYAMTQTAYGSHWTDLAKFLTRLLNETPRPDGNIPSELKVRICSIVTGITKEYEQQAGDLSACSLTNAVLAAASSSLETCIDKVKVGYVLMQLHHRMATTEGPAQALVRQSLDRVERTIDFVEKVNSLSLVYDQKSEQFEVLHLVPGDENEGEMTVDYRATVGTTRLNLPGLSLEIPELDIRSMAIATLNTEEANRYRVFRIGDEVEDILSLIYQQRMDVHQIEIRHVGCVTLKDPGIVAAALAYTHPKMKPGADLPTTTEYKVRLKKRRYAATNI